MSPKYKRVLLKLSGGVLGGDGSSNLDVEKLKYYAAEITRLPAEGLSVGIVIGGGNYFRGRSAGDWGLKQVTTDYMGMLGTVMNGMALAEYIENAGYGVLIQSAFPIKGAVPGYDVKRAATALDDGVIVVFTGGTGHPYFSTDTTAALRACEIGADVLLKASDVDGVYDKDPDGNPDAKLYKRISYTEVLEKGLKAMDAASTALCMENNIPIIVFNMNYPGNLNRAALGEEIGTLVG